MRTDLKRDEKVVLVIRPHWFVLVLPVFLAIIGIIIGIQVDGYGYLLPVLLFYYLGRDIVKRNYTHWAVTNLRVIEEFGVFSQQSIESPLDKIINLTYSQSILGRKLGYGDVQFQTVSEIGATNFYTVEDPKELIDTITRMQEEYKNAQAFTRAQELTNILSTGQ